MNAFSLPRFPILQTLDNLVTSFDFRIRASRPTNFKSIAQALDFSQKGGFRKYFS